MKIAQSNIDITMFYYGNDDGKWKDFKTVGKGGQLWGQRGYQHYSGKGRREGKSKVTIENLDFLQAILKFLKN